MRWPDQHSAIVDPMKALCGEWWPIPKHLPHIGMGEPDFAFRQRAIVHTIMYSVAEEMQAFLPSSLLIYVDVVRLSLPRLMRTLD